ncbi:hypothetical protein ABW20_dc0105250 [Dactylellina cionopaga]|nr:hypothetical protein ABW20_dc0105250 [Dactylellina cionopaga]
MAVVAKLLATILRVCQVLGTLYNTGCTTYFIVGLSNRNLIDSNGRAIAVEVISGAGFLWAVFALVFSICLLQKSFFQFFLVIGDLLFLGGFIAIPILLRNAWGNCNDTNLYVPWLQRGGNHLKANCEIIKGIFIVSIALCVLFFLTVLTAFLAHRSTKQDRAYGPSPSNNYTSGRGKRNRGGDLETAAMTGPALAPPLTDTRASHESKYTDVTDKTNGDLHTGTTTGTTTGAGREYLAPRGYGGNESTVSPVPSHANIRGKEHSHAGQYAMAGALAGGAAAAHHHHKKDASAYGTTTDHLPNHPGPDDHTTQHIPTTTEDLDRLGTMNTYDTNTNSMYTELDNTATGPQTPNYAVPGAYPGSRGAVTPTAYYPAANHNATELPSSSNPHYYSNEMDAGGYTAYPPRQPENLNVNGKRYDEYATPITPEVDQNREQVGFGYGNGPGLSGGGSNQVTTLPELGREDHQRF